MGRKRSYSDFSNENCSSTFSSGDFSGSSKEYTDSSSSQISESQHSASDSNERDLSNASQNSANYSTPIRNDERSLQEYFSEFKNDCVDVQRAAHDDDENDSLEESIDFDTSSLPLKNFQPQVNTFFETPTLTVTSLDNITAKGGSAKICSGQKVLTNFSSREKQKNVDKATADAEISLGSDSCCQPQLERFFKSIKPFIIKNKKTDSESSYKPHSNTFATNAADSGSEKQLNSTPIDSASLITDWLTFKRPGIDKKKVRNSKSTRNSSKYKKPSTNSYINKFQNANGENKRRTQSNLFEKSSTNFALYPFYRSLDMNMKSVRTKFVSTENTAHNSKENCAMEGDSKIRKPVLENISDMENKLVGGNVSTDIYLKSNKPQSNQQKNKHFNYPDLPKLTTSSQNSNDSTVSLDFNNDTSLSGPIQSNNCWERKFNSTRGLHGIQKFNSVENFRTISSDSALSANIQEKANGCNDVYFSSQKSSHFNVSEVQNFSPSKTSKELQFQQLYKTINDNCKNSFLSPEINDSPTFKDFEVQPSRTSTPIPVQNSELYSRNENIGGETNKDIEEIQFKQSDFLFSSQQTFPGSQKSIPRELNDNREISVQDVVAVCAKDPDKSILSSAFNDSVNVSDESYVFLKESAMEELNAAPGMVKEVHSAISFAPDDVRLQSTTAETNVNASSSKVSHAIFEDWSEKPNDIYNHQSNVFENKQLNSSNAEIDQICSPLNISLFSNPVERLNHWENCTESLVICNGGNTSPILNDLLSSNIPLSYASVRDLVDELTENKSLRSSQLFLFNNESLLDAPGNYNSPLENIPSNSNRDKIDIMPQFSEKADVKTRENHFGGDTNIIVSSRHIPDIMRLNALDSSGSETLSTGSRENFDEVDKRLREGMNRITRDKSLIYAGPKGPSVWQNEQKTNFLKTIIPQIFQQLIVHAQAGKQLEFPVRRGDKWKNCMFENEILKVKCEGNPSVVKFGHARFNVMIFLLGKTYALLMANSICTQREVYYQYLNNLKSQNQIRDGIDIISAMLGVEPWYFPIVSTSKGLVFGDLTITISPTQITHCNSFGGTLIPQDVTKIKQVKSKAFFILVVEKDAIFKKLLDEDIPNKFTRPFIMITGKGSPDINTRLFLKLLWVQLRIPVFILVDGDPHGIEIMLTYRFGSASLAHLSDHLALPKIRWLGIHPSEIVTLNITHQPLSDKERRKVELMLTRPYVAANAWLKRELEVLLERNFKAGIEGVIKNNSYLTDFYLANKFYSQEYF